MINSHSLKHLEKNLKKFFLGFFLFFITTSAHAGFFDPSLKIRTIKTKHFAIHFSKEATNAGRDMAKITEEVYAELSPKLGWRPSGRTHVLLMDKTDEANGLTMIFPANFILLYLTPPDAGSPLDNYTDYYKMLFTHEYTHILHLDQNHLWARPFRLLFGKIVAPNGMTPGWMREGLATWQESVMTGAGRANDAMSDMMLRTAIIEKDFPHIDEAAGNGVRWPSYNNAYIFGVKFWEWLNQKYGEESMIRYMKKYSSGLWFFSLNNKAHRVYHKSFYKLWKEWQADLNTKYLNEVSTIQANPLTPLTDLVNQTDHQIHSPLPRPHSTGYAYIDENLDYGNRIVIVPELGQKPQFIRRGAKGQLSFSNNGKLLAFSSSGSVEKYTTYQDVYVYDVNKKKLARVALGNQLITPEVKASVTDDKADKKIKGQKGQKPKSLRATDPDFSPLDGGARYLVMVRTNLGTDNLFIFDRKTKEGKFLTNASDYTQFSNPRFSPDGQLIAVSRHDHNGNRDMVIYNLKGEEVVKITNDKAHDNHPFWSKTGREIYFDSDKSGIPNLYRYTLATGTIEQVTNVTTGIFAPTFGGEDGYLLAESYSRKGYRAVTINKDQLSKDPHPSKTASVSATTNTTDPLLNISLNAPLNNTNNQKNLFDSFPTFKNSLPPSLAGTKKYHYFPDLLVPRYIVPTFTTLDSSFLVGLATGKFDPLYRHNWNAYATYRNDARFAGFGVSYSYLRYNPVISVGLARYALNWGNVFNTGTNFFEERNQGYIGIGGSRKRHQMSLSYFFETRDNFSPIPSTITNTLLQKNLDTNAGIHIGYGYSKYHSYPLSISKERGFSYSLGLDITDSVFGSSQYNEQQILTGDARYYINLPWKHHVLALRGNAGWAFGDRQFSGTFRFGGPYGEGNLAATSSRLFSLRGLPGITFAGDRAMVASAEYRIPLAVVERGIGTWPLYLNKMHLAFFDDYGDSWYVGGKTGVGFFDDFFMGVGGELRADMTWGYGLPVTSRLGYALLVHNSDQVKNIGDPLTRQSIQYGTFYLQFGTSF